MQPAYMRKFFSNSTVGNDLDKGHFREALRRKASRNIELQEDFL